LISDPSPQPETILTEDYYNFVPESKFFTYQFGLRIGREIGHSLSIYASPTLFMYNKDLMNNKEANNILTTDDKINNILFTYTRNKLQYIAIEFGLKYNFNSINLRKKQ
jgi:hypothetical protein